VSEDIVSEKGEEMLPSEMIILMATVVNKKTGKALVTRPMDVTGEYIGYLYDSLVSRGYMRGHRSTGYQLIVIGRKAIVDFMKKNKTRSEDIVKRLQLLGIEMGPAEEQKIINFKKEAIQVK